MNIFKSIAAPKSFLLCLLLLSKSALAFEYSKIGFQVPHDKHLAPELNLRELNRHKYYPKTIHQYAFSEKTYTLLHFWQINCYPCQKEIPLLNQFSKNNHNPRLRIISISPDKEKSLLSYMEKKNIHFPVLLDRERRILQSYEIDGFPITYLVDGQGYLIAKKIGQVHWDDPKIISFFENLK